MKSRLKAIEHKLQPPVRLTFAAYSAAADRLERGVPLSPQDRQILERAPVEWPALFAAAIETGGGAGSNGAN